MQEAEITIDHPEGIRIGRDTKMSDLQGLDYVRTESIDDIYNWFHFDVFPCSGSNLSVSLLYTGSKLTSLRMSLVHDDLYGSGWADYSEKKERKRARDMESWLRKQGIQNGSYSWGEVWVGFEGKTPFGGAAINFT